MSMYRSKKDGSLWDLVKVEATVTAHRQGGGYVYKIPKSVWDEDMVEVTDTPSFHRGFVALDDGRKFPAIISELCWNGWAIPYFTREVGEEVIRECLGNDDMGWYEIKGDSFITRLAGSEEDSFERAKGEDIVVDGVTHHVYNIGDGWIWSEVEDD